jgi:hypothetical protein
VLDTATGWVGAYNTYGTDVRGQQYREDIMPVACFDGLGNMYVARNLSQYNLWEGIYLSGARHYYDSLQKTYIMKYSPTGDLLWMVSVHNSDVKGLAVSNTNDTLYMFGDYEGFLGLQPITGQPVGTNGTGYENTYLAAIDSSGNQGWIQNFKGAGYAAATFMQKNCGGVLNCIGIVSDSITVGTETIGTPDKYTYTNFLLRYDPTQNNCVPQVCPVFIPSDIKQLNSNSGFGVNVYPNPFNTELEVNIMHPASQESTITITDILGRTVYSQSKDISGPYSETLNLSYLSNGVYALQVTVDGEQITKQIVKQ